jgi:hypothetical protein
VIARRLIAKLSVQQATPGPVVLGGVVAGNGADRIAGATARFGKGRVPELGNLLDLTELRRLGDVPVAAEDGAARTLAAGPRLAGRGTATCQSPAQPGTRGSHSS